MEMARVGLCLREEVILPIDVLRDTRLLDGFVEGLVEPVELGNVVLCETLLPPLRGLLERGERT
jgi:hypothetical protein